MQRVLPLLCFLICLCTGVRAQKQLCGFVTHDGGAPLMYATVHVPGSNSGDVTDEAGFFAVDLPERSKTISVSYLGYETRELSLENLRGDWLHVALTTGAVGLPVVVVVGQSTSTRICQISCGRGCCWSNKDKATDPDINITQRSDLGASVVYPNPFTTVISLRTELEADNKITVQLLNSLGQTLRIWKERPVDAGVQHRAYPVPAGLPPGPYFLRIADGHGREITRTIVKATSNERP